MSTRPRTPGPSAPAPGKLALPELGEMKRRGDRITMVTAYDAPSALLADQAGVELVLVGDSAAMVMLGHESTLPVTLDELIFLTRAVSRSARRPLVVGDLPFGTYEISDEQAVGSAIRMMKEGGADAVKLEGAGRMVSRIRAIADSNIGVVAHIGLTPQSATKLGGFRAQGRTADAAIKLVDEALALQEAGAFALVLEAVPASVATRITEALEIPTIGIGAGAGCDGQVLVWHDLLGLYAGQSPRFVKRYAELADEIRTALESFVGEVRDGSFPEDRHTYSIPDDELSQFEAALDARDLPGEHAQAGSL
ncbi:MAG TPA: 3-methyl-2-oxobutanoate hydroxymethyltransferase [Gaiellaceae bacterium]